jgi:hypothetical protein
MGGAGQFIVHDSIESLLTLDKNLTTFSVPELILLTEREEAMIETDSRKVVLLEAITAVVRIRPCEGVKEGAK